MEGRPPRYPLKLYAALILGAIGLTLILVGVTGDTGWTLIAPGFVAIIIALPIIWVTQGVGARLGPLLKLAEPETVLHGRSGGGYIEALSAGGGPSMPIEPGQHEVNAAIEVTFALEVAESRW